VAEGDLQAGSADLLVPAEGGGVTQRPVITFTVNNRVQYLAWVLESWRDVRGIENAHLIFRCEPGCDEAVAMCKAVDFAAETTIVINPQRFGVLGNPWHALNDGFAISDFTVLAEEDLIVAPDVLEYFAWCRDRYAGNPQVLAVTTHQYLAQPGGLAGVMPQRFDQDPDPHFWVWGTWRDRWERIVKPDWDDSYRARGWDWNLLVNWIQARGMKLMAPCLSRSQHVGHLGGVHCTPDQFETMRSRCFVPNVSPQEYAEVTGSSGLVAADVPA
jgi:hypothetical protein